MAGPRSIDRVKYVKVSRAERRRYKAVTSHQVEIQDDGEGNWLVSYADMMTLLFGFFVVLSVFSTPDASKFEKLRQHTSESMGGTYTKPFQELSNEMKEIFEKMKLGQELLIEDVLDGIQITSQSARFFDSGSAQLKEEAKLIVSNIGQVLTQKATGFRVVVEGHTDDVPINTPLFPSNWELSLRRSSEVVRLFETLGIPHEDLRPQGLADIKPLVTPTGLSGIELIGAREKNRRIVIKIQKKIELRKSEPTKGSLPQ